MQGVTKEIFTPSKNYKAKIIKRSDGFFEYHICEWTREVVPGYGIVSEWYWSMLNKTLSLCDTEDRAIQIAIEELRLYSGEMPE
ncbi:MAG: hypothetical protein WB217_06075 [Mesobacillus sp.]|uniref:hypothetical protein n=1 Tax=Mesobacillus sp. TaxID=2675271 RepID=UPI003C68C2B1